ncbi:hypothetical protein TWF694_009681 [Orbilia ellipsospora]|uniref:Uncharacterized protein n=1 Tax=Orbilia ellipsospora TaxID=2528407 RepID=A0AAV9XCU2_9PEZI
MGFEKLMSQPDLNHSIKGIQTVSVSKETVNKTLQPIAFRQPFKVETVFTYTPPNINFSVKPEVNASPTDGEESDVFAFTEPTARFTAPVISKPTTKPFSDLRYIDDFPEEWQEDLPTGYIQRAGKLEPAHIKAAPDVTQKSIKVVGGWEVLTSFDPETSIDSFLVTEEEDENDKVDIGQFEVKENVTFRKDWNPVTDVELSKFAQEEEAPETEGETATDEKQEPAPAPELKKENQKHIREALTPLLSYPKIEALLPPKEGLIVFTRQVVA